MAISRISVKVGRRGKGVPHFSYVMGIGKYADKDTEILHRANGNMPQWAKSPRDFWSSADELERANGSAYREHILSLPRELTLQQNIQCVQSWIDAQLSNKHTYSYAIHAPRARDGGTNYHAHIMFSDRTHDGVERTKEQYFKRANKKEPARGGAVKANSGMTWKEKKENLKAVRHQWGEHLREHLREHGFHDTAEKVDMRNWRERGLSEPPKNLSMAEIQMAKKMDDALSNHPYFIDLSKPPAPPAPTPKPKPVQKPASAPVVHHAPAPPAPQSKIPSLDEFEASFAQSLASEIIAPVPAPQPLPAHVTLPVFVHHAPFDRYADITGVIIGHYNLHNDRSDTPKGLETGKYRNIIAIFDTSTGEMVASSLYNEQKVGLWHWTKDEIKMLADRCEQEFKSFKNDPLKYAQNIVQRHNVNFHIPEKFRTDENNKFFVASIENKRIEREKDLDNDFTA